MIRDGFGPLSKIKRLLLDDAGRALDWHGIELATWSAGENIQWTGGPTVEWFAELRRSETPWQFAQNSKSDSIDAFVAADGAYYGGIELAVDENTTWRDLHQSLQGLPWLHLIVSRCPEPDCCGEMHS